MAKRKSLRKSKPTKSAQSTTTPIAPSNDNASDSTFQAEASSLAPSFLAVAATALTASTASPHSITVRIVNHPSVSDLEQATIAPPIALAKNVEADIGIAVKPPSANSKASRPRIPSITLSRDDKSAELVFDSNPQGRVKIVLANIARIKRKMREEDLVTAKLETKENTIEENDKEMNDEEATDENMNEAELAEYEREYHTKQWVCDRTSDRVCLSNHVLGTVDESENEDVEDGDLEYTGSKIFDTEGRVFAGKDRNPTAAALALWQQPDSAFPTKAMEVLFEEDNVTPMKSEFTGTVLYDIPAERRLNPFPRRIHIDKMSGKYLDQLLRTGFDMERDIIPRVRGMNCHDTSEDVQNGVVTMTITRVKARLVQRRDRYLKSIGSLTTRYDPTSPDFQACINPMGKALNEAHFLFNTRFDIDLESKTYFNTFTKTRMALPTPKAVPPQGVLGLKHFKVEVPNLKKFLAKYPEFKNYKPKDHALQPRKIVTITGIVHRPKGGQNSGSKAVKWTLEMGEKATASRLVKGLKKVGDKRRHSEVEEESEDDEEEVPMMEKAKIKGTEDEQMEEQAAGHHVEMQQSDASMDEAMADAIVDEDGGNDA
ncbi:hypothetical protein EJ08DRAFT_692558 [Tothia fuscella]|uniref:Uncharacterized protein n=1 Tax=Tothia fuscella TaxID=1048955 RepID=A0A9P4U364_9PEZI|nr:hypothetical protein EJ08DRAFT_692558 [Tothia fuscella]